MPACTHGFFAPELLSNQYDDDITSPGLCGSDGIIPASSSLRRSTAPNIVSIFGFQPTVVDLWLDVIGIVGIALAAAGVLGMSSMGTMLACWLLYLSLVAAGRDFTDFQWDALLLEVMYVCV
jgi:hypothetical protein